MELQQVHTQPDPYAPYLLSQAIKAGGLVYVSGQAGVGDDGRIVGEGDFDRQAEQAMLNLRRALVAAGSDLSQIVKVTIFLTSMSHFPKIVALRRHWFSAPYPADTIVEVSALYTPEAMIEIEAIAIADTAGTAA
ncbi:RidA family protein [Paucibacter sp. PLA-PC-4]|uniref:RidA family protein n=1 Tax=Paucibacter sp. PLA-PC-4 TaxID=2993655 RepID=UPI00224A8D8A|nr:RidA family protein [Paucibacter sp. PLA-PC-4]MCX2865795.1 RidA family protein [Paucibacter sp. PLA-PC-4]